MNYGVLICHQDPGTFEATYWDDVDQARQTLRELTPCGPRCGGVDTVTPVDVQPARRRRTARPRPPADGPDHEPAPHDRRVGVEQAWRRSAANGFIQATTVSRSF